MMSEVQGPKQSRREVVRRLAEALEERPEIVFAYLHGSFQEGLPFRDVDVAVFVEKGMVEDPVWYAIKLGVTLTKSLRLPVDVQVLNDAPLSFQFSACKGEVLVCRDEARRLDFLERTWDAYWDFRPFLREYLRELVGADQ